MSIFASNLRSAYKISGAKKAFGLPEDELKKVIERQNRKRAKVPYTAFARPKMVHCYCMLPVFKEAKLRR